MRMLATEQDVPKNNVLGCWGPTASDMGAYRQAVAEE